MPDPDPESTNRSKFFKINKIQHSIQITETSPLLHDANCVYCHVDLDLGDHVVVCYDCQSPHHVDCWQTHGNECAIFGCDGSGVIAPHKKARTERELATESVSRSAFRSILKGVIRPAISAAISLPIIDLLYDLFWHAAVYFGFHHFFVRIVPVMLYIVIFFSNYITEVGISCIYYGITLFISRLKRVEHQVNLKSVVIHSLQTRIIRSAIAMAIAFLLLWIVDEFFFFLEPLTVYVVMVFSIYITELGVSYIARRYQIASLKSAIPHMVGSDQIASLKPAITRMIKTVFDSIKDYR